MTESSFLEKNLLFFTNLQINGLLFTLNTIYTAVNFPR